MHYSAVTATNRFEVKGKETYFLLKQSQHYWTVKRIHSDTCTVTIFTTLLLIISFSKEGLGDNQSTIQCIEAVARLLMIYTEVLTSIRMILMGNDVFMCDIGLGVSI